MLLRWVHLSDATFKEFFEQLEDLKYALSASHRSAPATMSGTRSSVAGSRATAAPPPVTPLPVPPQSRPASAVPQPQPSAARRSVSAPRRSVAAGPVRPGAPHPPTPTPTPSQPPVQRRPLGGAPVARPGSASAGRAPTVRVRPGPSAVRASHSAAARRPGGSVPVPSVVDPSAVVADGQPVLTARRPGESTLPLHGFDLVKGIRWVVRPDGGAQTRVYGVGFGSDLWPGISPDRSDSSPGPVASTPGSEIPHRPDSSSPDTVSRPAPVSVSDTPVADHAAESAPASEPPPPAVSDPQPQPVPPAEPAAQPQPSPLAVHASPPSPAREYGAAPPLPPRNAVPVDFALQTESVYGTQVQDAGVVQGVLAQHWAQHHAALLRSSPGSVVLTSTSLR
jgi:hypothetical protein